MIQIDNLYIKSAFRKTGVGQQLLYELEWIAEQKNIRRIYVWCLKDNLHGKNFYEKMGAKNLDFFFVYKFFSEELLLNAAANK
jgi:GNAT superfamily N-acetyltransferase